MGVSEALSSTDSGRSVVTEGKKLRLVRALQRKATPSRAFFRFFVPTPSARTLHLTQQDLAVKTVHVSVGSVYDTESIGQSAVGDYDQPDKPRPCDWVGPS